MINMVAACERKSKQMLFLFILLGIAATYITFAPTVNIPFYHHDLYKYSTGNFNGACAYMPGYTFLFKVSRPGSAWLDCLNFKLGYTIEKMGMLRLLSVFLIGLTIGFMAHWLYCVTALSFWLAFFISGAIFFLPAMQTTMIMSATCLIVAVMLAFFASCLVTKSLLLQNELGDKTCRSHQITLLLIGTFLLLCSLFTYAALSAFFLVPILSIILFLPPMQWRKTLFLIVSSITIYCACGILFYLIAHNLQVYFLREGIESVMGAYQVKLNLNLPPRITTILGLLPQLWNVYFGPVQTIVVWSILGVGATIGLIKFLRSGLIIKHNPHAYIVLLLTVVAVVSLLVLGASFYLVQPENVTFSRIIFVYQAMIVLLVVWSLLQISSLFTTKAKQVPIGVLGGMFFIASVQANYTVTKSALNDNLDFSYLASSLADYLKTNQKLPKRIHLIIPAESNEKSFVGLPQRDDIFTVATTAIDSSIITLFKTALQRILPHEHFKLNDCLQANLLAQTPIEPVSICIASTPARVIAITSSNRNEPVSMTSETLVIDMNNLKQLNYQ